MTVTQDPFRELAEGSTSAAADAAVVNGAGDLGLRVGRCRGQAIAGQTTNELEVVAVVDDVGDLVDAHARALEDQGQMRGLVAHPQEDVRQGELLGASS